MLRKNTVAVFLIIVPIWNTHGASIQTSTSGNSQLFSDKTSEVNITGLATNETSERTSHITKTTNRTDAITTNDASTTYELNTTSSSNTFMDLESVSFTNETETLDASVLGTTNSTTSTNAETGSKSSNTTDFRSISSNRENIKNSYNEVNDSETTSTSTLSSSDPTSCTSPISTQESSETSASNNTAFVSLTDNKHTINAITTEDIEKTYFTNTKTLKNIIEVIDTIKPIITKNNTMTTITTVTKDTSDNATIIVIVTKNITVTVDGDVTNITATTVVTNKTTYTNSTKDIITTADIITTVILSNSTIVTITFDGTDTTVTTTTLNSTDVIETTLIDFIKNATMATASKNSSDVTILLRTPDILNKTFTSDVINTTTTLTFLSSNTPDLSNSTINCSSQGFFADPNSTNCISYIECIEGENGEFMKITSMCPDKSYYNPDTTLCDFDYKCPTETIYSPDPDIDDSCEDDGEDESTDTSNSTVICVSQGFLVDPDSTNCTSYIECIEDENGEFMKISTTCPENSYYNPGTTLCDFDYKCPTEKNYSPDPDTDDSCEDDDYTDTTNSTIICSSRGFFADPDSTNCTSYMECIDDENGEFMKVNSLCPDRSYYNPDTTLCDFDYKCPTQTTDSPDTDNDGSTNSTSICSSQGFVADPNSTNCTNFIECIQNENGGFTKTTYSCPDNSYYNPDTTLCDFDYKCPTETTDSPDPDTDDSCEDGEDDDSTDTTNSTLICTSQGFFVDSDSTNCTSYIECIENENGEFMKISSTCPDNSYYNPRTTLCDFDYKCPTTVTDTPDPDTDDSCEDDDDDDSTGTTNLTIICTSQGFFADPHSINCTSYIDCIEKENGEFMQLTSTCPGNSYYNPETTLCDFDYKCPTETTDSPDPDTDDSCEDDEDDGSTDITNSTKICSSQGFFLDPDSKNCTRFIECIENGNDEFLEISSTCPDNSYYNPGTTLCDFDYKCPTEITDSPDSDTDDSCEDDDDDDSTDKTNSTIICSSQGFLADPDSINCTSYIECIENENGEFMQLTSTCPGNSYYNPETTLCDFDYKCPRDSDQTTFKCTLAGRFAKTADKTCQAYYNCVLLGNGTFVMNEYVCPSTSVFDPINKYCTTTYSCASYPTGITGSSDTDKNDSKDSTFICSSQGFHSDPGASNCTTYIECIGNENGRFTQTTYTCPDRSYYNPDTTLCDFDYKCPHADSNQITFTCTSAGRFAKTVDKTCKTYYNCVLLGNGTFVLTEYSCPSVSVFDPINKYCTTTFSCYS